MERTPFLVWVCQRIYTLSSGVQEKKNRRSSKVEQRMMLGAHAALHSVPQKKGKECI